MVAAEPNRKGLVLERYVLAKRWLPTRLRCIATRLRCARTTGLFNNIYAITPKSLYVAYIRHFCPCGTFVLSR